MIPSQTNYFEKYDGVIFDPPDHVLVDAGLKLLEQMTFSMDLKVYHLILPWVRIENFELDFRTRRKKWKTLQMGQKNIRPTWGSNPRPLD